MKTKDIKELNKESLLNTLQTMRKEKFSIKIKGLGNIKKEDIVKLRALKLSIARVLTELTSRRNLGE